MRKFLETVGLVMLAILYWMTWTALNGPDPLPGRIPTHFDIYGNPNAWGSSRTLLLLPAVATGVYLLITVLASLPMRSRYPVRVTAENLPRLQELTRNMVCWIKVEMVCLFTYVQWSILQAARSNDWHMSPLMIPVFLVVVFGTVAAGRTLYSNFQKTQMLARSVMMAATVTA